MLGTQQHSVIDLYKWDMLNTQQHSVIKRKNMGDGSSEMREGREKSEILETHSAFRMSGYAGPEFSEYGAQSPWLPNWSQGCQLFLRYGQWRAHVFCVKQNKCRPVCTPSRSSSLQSLSVLQNRIRDFDGWWLTADGWRIKAQSSRFWSIVLVAGKKLGFEPIHNISSCRRV